jgi:hypothetical protein
MNDELTYRKMLSQISIWLEDFAKDQNDTTYLCFLRMLADYRHLQAQAVEEAIDRVENQTTCN